MMEHFNITSIGYAHLKQKKVCQDCSSSYADGKYVLVTACDGHGGDVYIRSHKGSQFASRAILQAMFKTEALPKKCTGEELEHNLKLNILCEWNRLVNEDMIAHPFQKKEWAHLSEAELNSLKQNPTKAYGTTLGGAMLLGNRLICVGLGDGGCFLFKNGKLIPAFPDEEDEPVANVTFSLCADDSFEHIRVNSVNMNSFDGVLLCTDGILGAYRSIENFKRSFFRPVVKRVLEGKTAEVKTFIKELGIQSGIGDDVSLAMILKNQIPHRFYK